MSDSLVWKEEGRKRISDFRIFSVNESYCRSPDNNLKTYTVIDSADWAIVVPVAAKTARGGRH